MTEQVASAASVQSSAEHQGRRTSPASAGKGSGGAAHINSTNLGCCTESDQFVDAEPTGIAEAIVKKFRLRCFGYIP